MDEIARIDYQDGIPSECMIYAFSDSVFGANIIFRLEGYSDPDHRVIICGHYDSFNNSDPFIYAPGADDNASGVASVLECARVLAGVAMEKTIEFILFDGEELGLFGSRIFAKRLWVRAAVRFRYLWCTFSKIVNLPPMVASKI